MLLLESPDNKSYATGPKAVGLAYKACEFIYTHNVMIKPIAEYGDLMRRSTEQEASPYVAVRGCQVPRTHALSGLFEIFPCQKTPRSASSEIALISCRAQEALEAREE